MEKVSNRQVSGTGDLCCSSRTICRNKSQHVSLIDFFPRSATDARMDWTIRKVAFCDAGTCKGIQRLFSFWWNKEGENGKIDWWQRHFNAFPMGTTRLLLLRNRSITLRKSELIQNWISTGRTMDAYYRQHWPRISQPWFYRLLFDAKNSKFWIVVCISLIIMLLIAAIRLQSFFQFHLLNNVWAR